MFLIKLLKNYQDKKIFQEVILLAVKQKIKSINHDIYYAN